MRSAVVVGGGVAGLVAALLAAKKGYRVSVVESAPECGGLLRSFEGADGHQYDHGTHLLRDTGNAALDRLLFGALDADAWQRLPHLRSGAYFAGHYSGASGSPNVNFLARSIYERGLAEMLERPPGRHVAETAGRHLVDRFGETFARHVFEPALRKFYGQGPEQLVSTAPSLFGMSRIIATTPEVTRELKRSAHLDSVFAFHDSNEGLSGLNNYYPARGGVGQWVQQLQSRLDSDGVSIRRGVHVASVSHDVRRISALTLSSGCTIEPDEIIWTINAAALLQRTSITFPSFKPAFRKTCLYCYTVDKPFHTDSYFYVCYDAGLRSFRTTLFSNLRSDPAERAHYSCCVEVLCDSQEAEPAEAEILHEQVRMGVVSSDARWTLVAKRVIPMGFPVMTPQFVKVSEEVAALVEHSFENVLLLGRASGGAFLMNAVLAHAYETIERRM